MSFPVTYLANSFNPFALPRMSLFVASAATRAFLAGDHEICWDKWDEAVTQGCLLYESFHNQNHNHENTNTRAHVQIGGEREGKSESENSENGIQGLGQLFQMIGLCAEISYGNLDPIEIQNNRRVPVKNGTRLYRLWELILPMVTNARSAAIIHFPAKSNANANGKGAVFCILRDRIHEPRLRMFSCDNLPMPWEPFPAIVDLDLDSKLEPLFSFIIQSQSQSQSQSPAQTAFEFAKIQLVV